MIKQLNNQLYDTIRAAKNALDLAQELSGVSPEEFKNFSKVKEIESVLYDSNELNDKIEKSIE